ncbi:uncharacterized protein Ldaf1 [Drosophila virilis]|uniref:Uncharacterized protein n=1 Tax=Drosophila virilis TaxID=7244 RepID=B4M332_DROVI|nr:uncharacterized protein LOC6631466 [Drosophila virilis]EDW65207.2 uncharacterized protein Dvir_GJ19137 [Drosophila virilis]
MNMTQTKTSASRDRATDSHASAQTNPKEDINKGSPSLNLEQLLDGIFQALQKLWLQGRRIAYFIMCELGGNELFEAAASWCVQHPDIAICLLAASFVFLLPLIIIFGFGIITLAITFTGILVLEGTLLTVILMIFLACISSLAIAVAVFAIIAYFGFSQFYLFFGMERHRDAFIKFLKANMSTANANESTQNTT